MAAPITVSADNGQAGMPSSFLTPGDARKVTKEQICAPGYVASIKPTRNSKKEEAFSRYGLRDGTLTVKQAQTAIKKNWARRFLLNARRRNGRASEP